MARSMLSVGMLFWRAVVTAVRSRGFALMSPPPRRAATVISLMNLVKSLPRRASLSAFLCLIELHLEWPDMARALQLPQAPRRVNHESQGERGIARAVRASIMRRDAGRDAWVGGALARRRRGLRRRGRAGAPAHGAPDSAAAPRRPHRLVHGRGRRAQRSRQGRAPPPRAGVPLPRRLRHPARGHERPLLSRAHRSLPAAHRRARARPTGRAARLPRHHRGRVRAVRRAAVLLAMLALVAGCASRRLVRHGQVNEDALETLRHRLVALRELAFTTPVPVLPLSREGIGSAVKDEIEQSYAPGDIEHAEAVYTRLGLLPPGTKLRPAPDGLYQQEGARFYDPRTTRLVVAESVPGAPSVGAGLLGFL